MADKKFNLTEAEANALMWTMVLEEDETNDYLNENYPELEEEDF
ncbi:hypothetical protein LCGC14_1264680 [marine sediment metagenome]|uniref:Uncharacterized protein n=1 Tax=marine sediment metagenome TaxID=412755 RepID=A0A0F9LL22_9ZZZZ